GKLRLDPNDQPGPLVLAAVATKKVETKPPASSTASPPAPSPESRLVVFGDSDFATNSFFNATSNGEMLLNVSNWLVGQEECIAIRPMSRLPSLVTLTQSQASLIWFVSIFIAPGTILVAGAIIWIRRRKL